MALGWVHELHTKSRRWALPRLAAALFYVLFCRRNHHGYPRATYAPVVWLCWSPLPPPTCYCAPAVHRYLGGIGGPRPASPADSLATIAFIQAQYTANGIGRWAVLLAATGEFMGWAGLKLVAGPVNGQRDFYDLGYRLRSPFWGQGYGYEAARAWLAAGFGALGLPRICAYADVHNAASCRILEKIGLQPGNGFVEGGTHCQWYEAAAPVTQTARY